MTRPNVVVYDSLVTPPRRQVQVTFTDDSYEPYEPHLGRRGRLVAMAGLLVAVTLAVYLPALRGRFIVGEDQRVVDNTILRARWEGLKALWAHPTLSAHYQPLAGSLLVLEYGGAARWRGFGSKLPQGYLVVNILLHAANVLLLWTLLRKLEMSGALAAAMLAAVHPIHVETVAWINQQGLLLCGVFYLCGLLVYLRYCGVNPAPPPGPGWRLPRRPWLLHGLSVVLLGAAVTSHAAAVSLPLVALAIVWWERGRLTRRDWLRAMPLLAISVVWLAVVMYADARRAAATGEMLDRGLLARVLIAARAMWVSLWHWILPVRLTFAPPKWTVGWVDVLALAGLIGAIGAAWWGRTRLGRGPVVAGVLLVIVLLPMFLVRTEMDRHTYVSDHLMYLGGMVLAAAVTAGAIETARRRLASAPNWLAPAATGLVVAGLAVVTLLRLPDFRSSENLWNSTLRRDPHSVLANNQLGLIRLNEKSDPAGAMRHFLAALHTDGNDPNTHINIAKTYEAEKQTQKAMDQYLQALVLSPDHAEAHFGLANTFAQQGNSEEAMRHLRRVLELRPDHVLAHNNMGLLHAQRGEFDEAAASYERAIAINPGVIAPYINLANLQFSRSRVKDAAATLLRAVRIDPTNYEAYMNAGAMVGQLAQSDVPTEEERIKLNEQAVQFFRHAIFLRPKSALACRHLGMSLLQQGRLRNENDLVEAIHYLSRAVELEPQNPENQRLLDEARRRQGQVAG